MKIGNAQEPWRASITLDICLKFDTQDGHNTVTAVQTYDPAEYRGAYYIKF